MTGSGTAASAKPWLGGDCVAGRSRRRQRGRSSSSTPISRATRRVVRVFRLVRDGTCAIAHLPSQEYAKSPRRDHVPIIIWPSGPTISHHGAQSGEIGFDACDPSGRSRGNSSDRDIGGGPGGRPSPAGSRADADQGATLHRADLQLDRLLWRRERRWRLGSCVLAAERRHEQPPAASWAARSATMRSSAIGCSASKATSTGRTWAAARPTPAARAARYRTIG